MKKFIKLGGRARYLVASDIKMEGHVVRELWTRIKDKRISQGLYYYYYYYYYDYVTHYSTTNSR